MVMAQSLTSTISEISNENFDFSLNERLIRAQHSGSIKDDNHRRQLSRAIVADTLSRRADGVDGDVCEAGEEDTFFVADLGDIYRQHMRWKMNLGRITPHYAVKCNPDTQVLKLLADLGTGFDCASKAEIEQILQLGVDPSRIIYAQPCKTKSYIRFAAQRGVRQMTFDNKDELYKIKQFSPDAQLYLRILTDDSASLCRLSLKFGASLDTTQELLSLAKDLDLSVVGVAFHVGSGASDPQAFLGAVKDARAVFDQGLELGHDMRNLDVGGGFVSETFESMAQILSAAIDEHFPSHVRVIGEPGRYYVSKAFTIACNIIARRTIEGENGRGNSYMLYLNDGVYGNFSSIMFDHQHPVPQVLKCQDPNLAGSDAAIEYSIWGPTCDGIDCITASARFNQTLDVGDWLFFEDMGAYTKCSATRFNGFTDKHEVIYVTSEPAVKSLLGV